MSLVSLKEMLTRATEEGYAIGAFNILNHLTAKAVIDTCEKLNSPVIIQMSVKTVKQIGIKTTVDTILPLLTYAKIPTTLHLDHCTDYDFAKACIDAGFPSIMIDASKKNLDENIRITKEMKAYGTFKKVDIEGELGAIVGVEEEIVVASDEGRLADVDSSERYVRETGVDAFAPAIGTAHGIYKGEPIIDFDRFAEIKVVTAGVPLVVHGGTGLASEVFKRLMAMGGAKINISTAIKIAYLSSIKEFFENNPKVSEPLQLDAYITDAVSKTVKDHITLFESVGKAWSQYVKLYTKLLM